MIIMDIMKQHWDILLLLDACRYDYFEANYRDFLEGELVKIESPASGTDTFLKRTFNEYYDNVVYVSANPYVNSRTDVIGFSAWKHFTKVVDVWDWGVDDEFGVVLPETMNREAIRARKKWPEARLIVHYMQPHTPFLSIGQVGNASNFILAKPNGRDFASKVRNRLDGRLKDDLLNRGLLWKIKETLGLPPASDIETVLRWGGREEVRRQYRENLRIVLKAVQDIVRCLDGEIVITSDHGEYLGEKGRFWHNERLTFGFLPGRKDPILREVPWFKAAELSSS
jgi:hypothetical protein